MINLSLRQQLLVGVALMLLLIMTRGHNLLSVEALPSASWAVFFLAGIYLSSRWFLPGLFAVVWLMDFSGYTWSGGSNFCLQSSYVFLLASYGVYWLTGRLFAHAYRFQIQTLIPLGLAGFLGGAIGYFISSAGFHFLSGRFAEPSWSLMWDRYFERLPSNFENLFFYIGLAAIIHVAFVLTYKYAVNQKINQKTNQKVKA